MANQEAHPCMADELADRVNNRLRICFVCLFFSPLVDGAGRRAEKQARQLQALGYDVTILTLRMRRAWDREGSLDNLSVIRIGGIFRSGGELRIDKFGIWVVGMAMFIALWRLRRSYDIIHVFQFLPIAIVATLIGRFAHKPVLISVQSTGLDKQQLTRSKYRASPLADTLTNTDVLKHFPEDIGKELSDIELLSDTIVENPTIINIMKKSNALYQILSSRGYAYLISHGFRKEQIVRISGSVDTEKFRPDPERKPDPSMSERTIICVARLEYAKGVDVLLHAWGRMMHASAEWRAHLKPHLLLAGEGKLRSRIELLVAKLGIEDSVEILGLRADVVDLLQQSWGFVLPSRWEGMPNALLEAMACGLPCIATCVSGTEDVIQHGVNGILVKPERPDDMAQALRIIIEDSELACRLGREARTTMVQDYQLINIVEQCLEVYHRLFADINNAVKQ